MRRGFTLIEVMVAIALLACGLLGVAAAGAMAARLTADGARAGKALTLGRARVELLASRGCGAGTISGSASHGPALIDEFWSVERNGAVALASDSVVFGRAGERRVVVLRTVLLC